MSPKTPTRRDFLGYAGSAVGGAWLVMHLPSIEGAVLFAHEARATGAQSFETLSPDEAALLQAIASRFYPTDETPGATEAGVVYFMDRALGSFWGWMLEPVQRGLAQVSGRLREAHPSIDEFTDLSEEQQDAVITWLQTQDPTAWSASNPFFLLQLLCSCGMFGAPSQGGNRDGVGWELVGFEPPRTWQPPFGYYDAEVMNSEGGDS
jgi:gluconate 2-dehydrogenase gamma chain